MKVKRYLTYNTEFIQCLFCVYMCSMHSENHKSDSTVKTKLFKLNLAPIEISLGSPILFSFWWFFKFVCLLLRTFNYIEFSAFYIKYCFFRARFSKILLSESKFWEVCLQLKDDFVLSPVQRKAHLFQLFTILISVSAFLVNHNINI
jgi:hypothetical protein